MEVISTINALRKRCPSFGGRVYGAAEFGNIQLGAVSPSLLPAAYVVCTREDPSESNRSSTSFYQEIINTIAVVVVVSNSLDERGQNSSVEMESLKAEIFKAILGWGPNYKEDSQSYYEYNAYSVLTVHNAALVVQLDFQITTAIDENDARFTDELEIGEGEGDPIGTFNTLDVSVDNIEQPANKPDGEEEAHYTQSNLYTK